ncbi:Superfamily II DNA and RNA helicase [Fulvimarina pelagi HTCC2506]|uniref:Superfamily II DNA and RNA helicase n=1 Tax=Fulvimarina pelagi HTCC2506 TaxID=314231 RepID=Q0G0P8_9HYPH|nr:DEAD/DEAH box helicase [Fulvimarina pelagi]EAU40941.1 Superfamily II DNA and RNA helicase [Fulvimarina pelagi HTCC2506]
MTSTTFDGFGLAEPLTRALARLELTTPTPIQERAIPHALAGRDMLGIAQTGTGKTAAFALPLLHHLMTVGGKPTTRTTKALILSPTRELAVQIAESIADLSEGTPISHCVVFGGVSVRPQIQALARGVDILVATPGRLLDLMEQRAIDLRETRHLILDEADRMLDMGFVRDVMKIVGKCPDDRQSMMFSATMPKPIEDLSKKILTNPQKVSVTPAVVTVEKIAQSVFSVPQRAKKHWLIDFVSKNDTGRIVVFTRTKHGANRLTSDLDKAGIQALAIHGNKSQTARQKALGAFQDGEIDVLVATDIVARGIHVDDISHVVNFDLPEEPESYVHRIGRTARAGRSGQAIALVDPSERAKLKQIIKLTGIDLTPQATDYTVNVLAGELDADDGKRRGPRNQQPRNGRPRNRGKNGNGGRPNGGAKRQNAGGETANRSSQRPSGKPRRSRRSGDRSAANA